MVNRVIRAGSCEKNDIYLKWFAVEIAPGDYTGPSRWGFR